MGDKLIGASRVSGLLVSPVSGCFTIAFMPDTQYLVEKYPGLFTSMCTMIANEQSNIGIQILLQCGDVVNVSNSTQWNVANNGFDLLDAANIPYLVIPGNHDYDDCANRVSTSYNGTFPQSRYTGKSWWSGGFYHASLSDNLYILRTIDGVDYIFLGLEYGPRQAVVNWANGILNTYAARKAIVVTHCFLMEDATRCTTGDTYNPHTTPGFPGDDCHDGEEMWNELIKLHDNVILVLSGHQFASPYSASRSDNSNGGQPVIQAFVNFQGLDTINGLAETRLIAINQTTETQTHATASYPLGAVYNGAAYNFSVNY